MNCVVVVSIVIVIERFFIIEVCENKIALCTCLIFNQVRKDIYRFDTNRVRNRKCKVLVMGE